MLIDGRSISNLEASVGAYDYCALLSDSRWAWEFLRRNPDFLRDAAASDPEDISYAPACFQITLIQPRRDQTAAQRWGLAFFPDISQTGLEADAFWLSGVYARAVQTQVGPRGPGEICEIYDRTVRRCTISHLTDTQGREHLLLKSNGCVIQAVCTGLSIMSREPVKLSFVIDSIEDFASKLRTLSRAQRVYEDGAASEAPEWTRQSLALRNALIALDCNEAGYDYRRTAAFIYGEARAEEAWAGPSRAMKDEMRRALQRGRELTDGGYLTLLS